MKAESICIVDRNNHGETDKIIKLISDAGYIVADVKGSTTIRVFKQIGGGDESGSVR